MSKNNLITMDIMRKRNKEETIFAEQWEKQEVSEAMWFEEKKCKKKTEKSKHSLTNLQILTCFNLSNAYDYVLVISQELRDFFDVAALSLGHQNSRGLAQNYAKFSLKNISLSK